MNSRRKIQLAIISLLLALADSSFAGKFQLKGVSLGMPAALACGESRITDNFGEIVRKYKPDEPALVEMGTTECDVEYPSFGGNTLSEPAKLLFLNGALILIKIELNNLTLSKFVDIYKALTQDYGKSKRTKSPPFVTDTWKQNGETLILERLGRQWDDNDITIILRADDGFKTYQSRLIKNSELLEKLDTNKMRNDIR